MKTVEILDDINPFYDATTRMLVKFRDYSEIESFYKQHYHLCGSEQITELKLFTDYLIEIDLFTEYPYISITNKDELIRKLKTTLEFFENSVL